MAAVISGITLFREKSTVHRFGFGGDQSDDDAVLAVRSNRITLQLKAGGISEQVVVRGQNIPAALRLTALVLEQFNRNPTILDENPLNHGEWMELWKHRISDYERKFLPESWVSLHHDGQPVFTTNPSTQIDEIERVALGGELNDKLIRDATARLLGENDADGDVVTQHDSQTAVVFTPFKEYHRAAILERRGGRTGSFAVSAYHQTKPKKNVRYSGFINFCADIIEALNLKVFLDRIKQMVEENRIHGPPVSPEQVAAAMARKRDIMQFIVAYERANKIAYRPERPEFF